MFRFWTITMMVVFLFSAGCSSKVAQRGGFTINYLPAENSAADNSIQIPPVRVVSIEGRDNPSRDIVEDAKPTGTESVRNFLIYGVFSFSIANQIKQSPNQNVVDEFRVAMEQRLALEGATVSSAADDGQALLEIVVREISLDYDAANAIDEQWLAKIAYQASMRMNGNTICKKDVYERYGKWNAKGNASGQDALDEAFTRAINAFDWRNCFGMSR
jgi:hypothetical protein